MKPRSARCSCRAAAVKVAAAGVALMFTFAALASAPAMAQDGASSGSDWERLDQVLVIPRVYKPAVNADAPAVMDGPAAGEGCGSSSLGQGPGGAIAVAGTADCANTNAPQMQAEGQSSGSADTLDSTREAANAPVQSVAPGIAQAAPGGPGPSVGTMDDYRRQQEAAAEASAAAGVGRMPPPVIVGPPRVPYYLPRSYKAPAPPMAHIYVPSPRFPRAPLASWMPRPRPPMVVAPPAWMPRASVPMVAARPPIFIPRSFGSVGARPGPAGIGGWRGR